MFTTNFYETDVSTADSINIGLVLLSSQKVYIFYVNLKKTFLWWSLLHKKFINQKQLRIPQPNWHYSMWSPSSSSDNKNPLSALFLHPPPMGEKTTREKKSLKIRLRNKTAWYTGHCPDTEIYCMIRKGYLLVLCYLLSDRF